MNPLSHIGDFGYYAGEAALFIFAREPGACGRCHTARIAFVNRNGRTLCLFCDDERGHGDPQQ